MDIDNFNTPIILKISEHDQPLNFHNIEEVEQWVKNEKEQWITFLEYKVDFGQIKNYIEPKVHSALGGWKKVESIINQVKSVNSSIDEKANRIESGFHGYTTGEAIYSKSPKAQHAMQLFSEDPKLAYVFIFLMQGNDVNIFFTKHLGFAPMIINGIIEVYMFSNKGNVRKNFTKKSLNDFVDESNKILNDQRSQLNSLSVDHDCWNNRIKELIKKSIKKASSLRKSAKDEWQQLIDVYRKKIDIEESVSYWKSRKTWSLWVSIIAGVIFVFLLSIVPLYILNSYGTEIYGFIKSTKDSNSTIVDIILLTTPVFFYVWLLKHVSRIFVMNLSFQSDASERVVMIKTFLALMQESHVTKDDKMLILESIFRSSTTSHADDGSPPHWLPFLIKKMDNK